MQEVHVACPCCKNKRLFDADPAAVEALLKSSVRYAKLLWQSAFIRKKFVLSESAHRKL